MLLHPDRPGVACTLAVSLVAAAAAFLPATARAEDPLASLDATAPLAGAMPVATDAIASTAPELAPVLAQVTEADAAAPALPVQDAVPTSEPAPGSTTAAEPAATPSAPAQVTDPAPSGDIAPAVGDIASDTPVSGPEPAEQPAPTAPAKADPPPPVTANVNVSVRIDSPGDNGSVTQVNLTGGGMAPGGTSAAADRDGSAGGPSSDQPSTTRGVTQDPVATASGEWYWNWDCLGATSGGTVSPQIPEGVSFPTSWTWNWNCGDNSLKYQGETSPRYQPINTNISIRISSPGNDGPVSQVNIGAAIAVSLPAPVIGLPEPAGSAPLPASVTDVLDAVFESPATAPAPVSGDTTAQPLSVAPAIAAAGTPAVAPAALGAPPASAAAAPFAIGLQAEPWRGAWWRETMTGRLTATGRSVAAQDAWQAAASRTPRAAGAAPADRRAVASPRRLPRAPGRAPLTSVSGASASSAGVSGSSGSGLPALLLLPFVAALLDLARRVALEHAALPSGHRRRAPDRPG
jgi:Meckel syndrome type 1 protein